jgi:hypothetical protein
MNIKGRHTRATDGQWRGYRLKSPMKKCLYTGISGKSRGYNFKRKAGKYLASVFPCACGDSFSRPYIEYSIYQLSLCVLHKVRSAILPREQRLYYLPLLCCKIARIFHRLSPSYVIGFFSSLLRTGSKKGRGLRV